MVKPAIVVTDNCPQTLQKLMDNLRQRYHGRFRIIGVDSGQQALNQLKHMSLHKEPVAFLLADEQMPEMSGSEFLKAARDLYPRAKRILLTTYADTHAAIQATSLFIFIGAEPHTEWLRGVVRCDEKGFILTGPDLMIEQPSPLEMCGMALSNVLPLALAREPWPFSSSIGTWGKGEGSNGARNRMLGFACPLSILSAG